MEKSILIGKIHIAYQGSIATREIIESYIGKVRASWILSDLDSKAILEAYTKDCQRFGFWRLKRQVTDTKSESLAGWKACKSAAENILKAQPASERAQELLEASVVYNRISTMIATVRAEMKKPATATETSETGEAVIPVYLPTECPITTCWDMDSPYVLTFPVPELAPTVASNRQAIAACLAKANDKSSKVELLSIIEELRAIA